MYPQISLQEDQIWSFASWEDLWGLGSSGRPHKSLGRPILIDWNCKWGLLKNMGLSRRRICGNVREDQFSWLKFFKTFYFIIFWSSRSWGTEEQEKFTSSFHCVWRIVRRVTGGRSMCHQHSGWRGRFAHGRRGRCSWLEMTGHSWWLLHVVPSAASVWPGTGWWGPCEFIKHNWTSMLIKMSLVT